MYGHQQLFEIVATIGPSCKELMIIQDLINSGVTGFRFPFSKATPEWQTEMAHKVKQISDNLGKHVDLIMDLPGTKPRITNKNVIEISKDQIVQFVFTKQHISDHVVNHANLILGVWNVPENFLPQKEEIVLTGDGELAFEIQEILEDGIYAKSLTSGMLLPTRGFTIQGSDVINQFFSKEDEVFLSYFQDGDFNQLMVSFCRSEKDIEFIREKIGNVLSNSNRMPKIFAKIETEDAVRNLEEIVKVVDRVLVARGDLALQTGLCDFFEAQEKIINTTIKAKKPVIVGTQLLESAGNGWIPYRAELSDVSRLLSIGINGILLSAETSISKNPTRVVDILQQLIKKYRKSF